MMDNNDLGRFPAGRAVAANAVEPVPVSPVPASIPSADELEICPDCMGAGGDNNTYVCARCDGSGGVRSVLVEGEHLWDAGLFDRLIAGAVWSVSVADHEAEHLTPRQIERLYAASDAMREAAPLCALVRQLLEALKLADALLRGANMNREAVERKVSAAIVAATGAA